MGYGTEVLRAVGLGFRVWVRLCLGVEGLGVRGLGFRG